MNRKIPPGAFAFYLGLGPGRSYASVARQFGVSKKAVVLCAERENWQERLAQEEKKAREAAEKQAALDLKAANERHLKVARFVQGKAIERIKTGEFETVMDAVKAYALMIDKERLILGEPTEHTALEIEKKIRAEHERWLVPVEEDATGRAEGDAQAGPQPAGSEPPAGAPVPSTTVTPSAEEGGLVQAPGAAA